MFTSSWNVTDLSQKRKISFRRFSKNPQESELKNMFPQELPEIQQPELELNADINYVQQYISYDLKTRQILCIFFQKSVEPLPGME